MCTTITTDEAGRSVSDVSAWRLLQISDSAFPRGSFAHSLGLESYVAEGAVTDADSLREFIENVLLESTGPLDGPYLREAHSCAAGSDGAGSDRADSDRADSDGASSNGASSNGASSNGAGSCEQSEGMDRLQALDRAFSAAKPVAPLREASRTVGRQFLRTMVGCADDAFLLRYEGIVRTGRSPGHYPLALGVAARALGIGVRQALESLCYGVVSGFVSAAVRLVPLGQTDGQRVMAETEEAAAAAVEVALALPLEEAYSTGPGHEIRAMAHQRLHTRLFVT